MTSAGKSNPEENPDNWLQLIRVATKTFGGEPEDRISLAPPHLHGQILEALAADQRREAPGVPPTTINVAGPRPWYTDYNSDEGYHWSRLRGHLLNHKRRSVSEVNSLHVESDHVLAHLEDPSADGPASFDVRGLVVGYVQSGKTANFTALIAKAADRGYKLVIVLSGIHNSLRGQTQSRINKELGLEEGKDSVGIPIPAQQWWGITSADDDGDFKPSTDPGPLAQGVRAIMVIKKNATVLRRLVKWLERVPENIPTLIIDDEADQASINTSASEQTDLRSVDIDGTEIGDEIDPSTINGLIREIVNKFSRVSYVAYTATPFANVLIDPDQSTHSNGKDLYPRDFIISLGRHSTYFGAERFFRRTSDSDDESSLRVIRTVPDNEIPRLSPTGTRSKYSLPTVDGSLADALLDWVLASAANDQRNGTQTSSMLIHTSPSIQTQNDLKIAVAAQIAYLQNQWSYSRNELSIILEKRWNQDFVSTTTTYGVYTSASYQEVYPYICKLLAPSVIRVLALNSSSNDILDFDSDSNQKLILIGGNRLSRGITVENLLVSFYVRASVAYDTLLQMGRWFGYRGKYADLTRLWTTTDILERFRHLALVEQDLRDEIKSYEARGLSPLDMAPKIRAHPAMLVTARNRMGSGQVIKLSYSGQLVQTIHFDLDNPQRLRQNLDLTKTLMSYLGSPHEVVKSSRPVWNNVPAKFVVPFLQRYLQSGGRDSYDLGNIARYIQRQNDEAGELTDWTIVVRAAENYDAQLGDDDLGIHEFPSVNLINRSRRATGSNSIGALVTGASNGSVVSSDESLDLSPTELRRAQDLFDAGSASSPSAAIRLVRPPNRALLIVYPISASSQHKTPDRSLFEIPSTAPTVIGVALSLPTAGNDISVDYVVGKPSSARSI